MTTKTQTIRKLPVQPGRTHDYLYDKVHVLASERDHARATFKAHTGTSRVKQVPIYPTMFSELRHYPRFHMRLDMTDPVPQFVNRQWPGYADQQREAVIRHKTFNYAPHLRLPPVQYEDAKVTGVNRYKYFRRPIIPFLQQVPPDVVLATARQDSYGQQDTFVERPLTPLTRTVEVQTMYRDGEAQTDPYTPEYVIRPGEQPELLTLATLSYGRGLPAGLAEVEMIERARSKRAWEATLPPLNDTSQLEKRRKMMDDMETKEWALREQEIEKLQAARLEVLKDLLRQREENQQNLNIRRLDKVWGGKQQEKDHKVKQIRKEHIKAIRKLTRRRRAVEGRLERRDIVHDLSDPGSQVYAPLTRIGVFTDRGSEQYVVRSKYLNSYQGLCDLESSLPQYVLNPRVMAPKPKTVTRTGFVRRKQRQEQELAQLHQVIKEMKTKADEPPKPLRFLQKIEKPVPRPPTPAVDVPSEEEEEVELAVIFLQKLIRGRAIQNMMFEGKEKRMELIKELRSTHALQEAEQLVKKQDKQATLALQRQRRLHEHKESFVDECLSQVEGSSVGDMLDFLTKELVRLQEERRIHAFAMLAERQRRLREAEESGRRQVEERRRREHDEIFKQVTKVHQLTVDTYLENIILDAVEQTADQQARREVHEMAAKINDVAYQLEESRSKLESEEIVSELIHCFLLPEAQKATVREKVSQQQRKYLLAAHKEIHKDGSDVINQGGSPTAQTPTSRPGSQTEKGSRPGSGKGSRPTSGQGSRPASQQDKPSSRPASASGEERPASQTSEPASRPASGHSRRASQQAEAEERPASQQERPALEQSDESEKPGSRPASQQEEEKASSRPASGRQEEKPSSRPASQTEEIAKASSRPSSQQEEAEQRPASQQEDKEASRPASQQEEAEERPASGQAEETTQQTEAEEKESSRPASQQQADLEEKASSEQGEEQAEQTEVPAETEQVAADEEKAASRPSSQQAEEEKEASRPASVAQEEETIAPAVAQLQGGDEAEAEQEAEQQEQEIAPEVAQLQGADDAEAEQEIAQEQDAEQQEPAQEQEAEQELEPSQEQEPATEERPASGQEEQTGEKPASPVEDLEQQAD